MSAAGTFWATLLVLGLAVLGMAVGVLLSNREIKGSCGGIGRITGEDCEFCEHKDKCEDGSENKKSVSCT